MNKLIIALIVGMSFTAQAEQTHCESIEILATAIMKIRQMGVPLSEALAAANHSKPARQMIIVAYKMSMQPNNYKRDIIETEFASHMMLKCLGAKK